MKFKAPIRVEYFYDARATKKPSAKGFPRSHFGAEKNVGWRLFAEGHYHRAHIYDRATDVLLEEVYRTTDGSIIKKKHADPSAALLKRNPKVAKRKEKVA